MSFLDEVPWNGEGLIAAVAQDAKSGRVLTVAWMNRDALQETVDKKRAVYWSRSRRKLWRKGEESGNVQKVVEVRLDCDSDAVLLKVEQALDVTGARRLAIGGGVAANSLLRRRVTELCERRHLGLKIPPSALCTDNAAMIASAARFLEPVAYPGFLAFDAFARSAA